MSMEIKVRAHFDPTTEAGSNAVSVAVGLAALGAFVTLDPLSVKAGLPAPFTELLQRSGKPRADVGLQLGEAPTLYPKEIASMGPVAVGWASWDRFPLTESDMTLPRDSGWSAGRTRYWSKADPESIPPALSTKDYLNLMVADCPETLKAILKLDPNVRVTTVPMGFDPKPFPVVERETDRPFRFLAMGNTYEIERTIEAFQLAQVRERDFEAELIIKAEPYVVRPEVGYHYDGVKLIVDEFDQKQMIAMYASCDVLVVPRRSDATAMEFMATGGPVIGSGWGSQANWLLPETGWGVGGSLAPRSNNPHSYELKPDVEGMAGAMIDAWQNRPQVVRRGEWAASYVRAQLAWDKTLHRLLQEIAKVW